VTASSRWSLAAPKSAAAAADAASFTGLNCLKSWASTNGASIIVLLDFLGDVVCGGFGLPIARDMCQKVIVVGSNDLQSLYVANNVCKAVEYFRSMGGNVGVGGHDRQQGRWHGRGCRRLPKQSTFPCSARSRRTKTFVANQPTIRSSAGPTAQWGGLFEELASNVGDRAAAPARAA